MTINLNVDSARMIKRDGQVVRVLVVEDHDLMRLGLVQEIKKSFDNALIQAAASANVAMTLMAEEKFDLIILDPGLPGADPTSTKHRLNLVREALESCPEALLVVITGSDTVEEARECQRLGANAYAGKGGLNGKRLLSIIHQIAQGEFCMRLSMSQDVAPEIHYSALSPREQDMVDYMRRRPRGMKRKELYSLMSDEFKIDPDTLEKYFKTARAKLMKNGINIREL